MFQKLIDKLLNPYLTSKIQRIGFLIILVSISIGGCLWIYLDDYDDSNVFTVAFAGFLLGIYLVYIHHKVDSFLNSQDKVEIQVPTGLIAKASSSSKKILTSKITHYVVIFVIAFIYSALREIWVGNFNIDKHRLDLFIASTLGAAAFIGGIPILFGKYVSIPTAYVVFIMLLVYNGFDASVEKEKNRLKAIEQASIKNYIVKVSKLHGVCAFRLAILSNSCKSTPQSNPEADAICGAGAIQRVPEGYRNHIEAYLSSEKFMKDINSGIERLEGVILKGDLTPSTSGTYALSMKTGSIKHKVDSDCKIFEANSAQEVVSLANDVNKEAKHLLDANVVLE